MDKISKNTKALTILDLEKNENYLLFKKLNEIVQLENKYINSEIKLSKDAADKIGYDLIYDTESETTKVIAHEQQPA